MWGGCSASGARARHRTVEAVDARRIHRLEGAEPAGTTGATADFDQEPGDCSDDDAVFAHPESWRWSHGLGEIVIAVVTAGLRLEFLHEHPFVAWHLNDKAHLSMHADEL
ncbi:MAG: hypothetical protein M0004_01965 [Actinomycetota bacterium]|nr:hypothetical protein [Actinomycetota bacterium]